VGTPDEQMLASVLIIAVSLVLFIYWFRYTCLLLLNGNAVTEHAGIVARANRLTFLDVRLALREELAGAALETLHSSLERDYRILLYLLEHSAGLDLPSIEQKLLVLDYRLMQIWYKAVRGSSATRARQALLEMSNVLGYFSQKMGERAAQYSVVS
jgi:hypothetical protein